MSTTSTTTPTQPACVIEIDERHSGQRLDNFLIGHLKGVPKSHIYRMLRKGEVRVNKGRRPAECRLVLGDRVRIPPLRRDINENTTLFIPTALRHALEHGVLYEDNVLLVLNKPAGVPVHGGTGLYSGVIEGLRALRPHAKLLELVHRLDRETSGCLLIAKQATALKTLHAMFRAEAQIQKYYLALLAGRWSRNAQRVEQALLKNVAQGGERMVKVSVDGKPAVTLFRRVQRFASTTLVEAEPLTGRTHQIRVHAAWLGHPIVGDTRYGDDAANRLYKQQGGRRLFLHARTLAFCHPVSGERIECEAPLPDDLQRVLTHETAI